MVRCGASDRPEVFFNGTPRKIELLQDVFAFYSSTTCADPVLGSKTNNPRELSLGRWVLPDRRRAVRLAPPGPGHPLSP